MPLVAVQGPAPREPLVLNYEVRGEEHAGSTVVLLHELGGTLASFEAFGRELARHRRVIAFDQRGAGLSEKPARPWTLADLADDVDGLASALELDAPFHLVGLAMGAVTALHFGLRHARRLASLVLIDGTTEITADAREYIVARARRVRQQGMRPVIEQSFANAFRGIPDAAGRFDWYRQRFLTHAPESYSNHSEALAAMSLGERDLGSVVCPALALTGEHDFIWPPSTGRKLASLLPAGRFAVVERAAHFPAIQDPVGTAARASAFHDEVDAGRSVG